MILYLPPRHPNRPFRHSRLLISSDSATSAVRPANGFLLALSTPSSHRSALTDNCRPALPLEIQASACARGEMVDALLLGSSGFGHRGSSPLVHNRYCLIWPSGTGSVVEFRVWVAAA